MLYENYGEKRLFNSLNAVQTKITKLENEKDDIIKKLNQVLEKQKDIQKALKSKQNSYDIHNSPSMKLISSEDFQSDEIEKLRKEIYSECGL